MPIPNLTILSDAMKVFLKTENSFLAFWDTTSCMNKKMQNMPYNIHTKEALHFSIKS